MKKPDKSIFILFASSLVLPIASMLFVIKGYNTVNIVALCINVIVSVSLLLLAFLESRIDKKK